MFVRTHESIYCLNAHSPSPAIGGFSYVYCKTGVLRDKDVVTCLKGGHDVFGISCHPYL